MTFAEVFKAVFHSITYGNMLLSTITCSERGYWWECASLISAAGTFFINWRDASWNCSCHRGKLMVYNIWGSFATLELLRTCCSWLEFVCKGIRRTVGLTVISDKINNFHSSSNLYNYFLGLCIKTVKIILYFFMINECVPYDTKPFL